MNKKYTGADRRKFKRLKASLIVIYRVHKPLEALVRIGTREINALMLDLSEGGMAIVTNCNIPVSTILLIKFTLINPYTFDDERIRTMEITGQIRNNALLEKKEYRLGVCFTQIAKEDRIAIANFVKMAINR